MLHTEFIAPVPELLERHAAARPEKVAYWDSTRSVTYRQLARRTAAIAASLTKMGVREGDKVALCLPNGVDWIEACFACLRAGAVVVPISHEAAEGEISYRLEDAGCRMVFTSAARKNLVAKLSADSSGSAIIVIAGEGAEPGDVTLDRLASEASGDPLDPSDIDRASFILYTSGTTGRAKGVLLSVRGMLWIAAACWAPICGLSERDVVLSPLPLFHIMTKFSPQQTLELLQLHLSPITCSALETELGRPARKRLPSEARLVLRPPFARDRPAPGPSRYSTSLAVSSLWQWEHATTG
jgi:long-chain acyl-CoA synthetase